MLAARLHGPTDLCVERGPRPVPAGRAEVFQLKRVHRDKVVKAMVTN